MPIQQRLFEHNPNFRLADANDPAFAATQENQARRAGLSVPDYVEQQIAVWERRPEVQDMIARIAEMGRARSVPTLSHDDTQDETRHYYRNLGARITEFPMTVDVARLARDAGDAIVFGAPNVVRGGSHIRSPSAADMVEAGLCDILASDYFYPSMLAAIALLCEQHRLSLPKAWALVSSGPAKALDLTDRGGIAPGMRADLVLIDWPVSGAPAVNLTMSNGSSAYMRMRR